MAPVDSDNERAANLYVNLREHFEKLWIEREKLLDEKFRSNKEAISLAREQVDHRLEGMNEFQKRMDKLEGTFATRKEVGSVERLVYIGVGIVLALQLTGFVLFK